MLRRSTSRLLSEGQEFTRRRNQAVRQLLWNPDGTLNIAGAAYYAWDWVGAPVKFTVGLFITVYFYNQYLIKIETQAARDTRDCQDAHHKKIRESGRLMSERHLTVQNRHIEDPDFPDNLPGFQEKYKSRILDDDEYARATSTDERRFAR
jgi:hypothetical protein